MADKSKRDSVNLTQGILLDQLPDGGTLVGHINGEDVLLARPEPELWVQLDLRHPAPVLAPPELLDDTPDEADEK